MGRKRKLTEKQWQQEKEGLLSTMHAEARPFKDTPDELKARIESWRTDKIKFKEDVFPHYCGRHNPYTEEFEYIPSSPYHKEIFDLCDIRGKGVSIVMPRGWAKSTHVTLIDVVHGIVFDRYWLQVIISATDGIATDFVRFIKVELEENPQLKQAFGELRGKDSKKWTESYIVTANDKCVCATSPQAGIRGIRHGSHRPDRIIMDDLENDQMQKSPKRLRALEKLINEAIMNTLEPEFWSVIYVGTLLSPQAVLAQYMNPDKYPAWVRRNLPAIIDRHTPDERSGWPERESLEYLKSLEDTIGATAFNKEKMGIVQDDDTQTFKRSWMETGRVPVTRELIKECGTFLAGYLDANAKDKKENDYTAIILAGYARSKFHLLHSWIRHGSPEKMFQRFYFLDENFNANNPLPYTTEIVAFQEWIKPLRELYKITLKKNYLVRMGYREGAELGNKQVRIESLQGLMETGQIVFCEDGTELSAGDMDLLMDQFFDFPNSTANDDGPDAVEGAIWALRKMGAGRGEQPWETIGHEPAGMEMYRERREGLRRPPADKPASELAEVW